MPPKIQITIQINQAENGFVVQLHAPQQNKQFIAENLDGATKVVVDFVTALKDVSTGKPNA